MKAQNKTGSGKAEKKGIFSGLVSKLIGKKNYYKIMPRALLAQNTMVQPTPNHLVGFLKQSLNTVLQMHDNI